MTIHEIISSSHWFVRYWQKSHHLTKEKVLSNFPLICYIFFLFLLLLQIAKHIMGEGELYSPYDIALIQFQISQNSIWILNTSEFRPKKIINK